MIRLELILIISWWPCLNQLSLICCLITSFFFLFFLFLFFSFFLFLFFSFFLLIFSSSSLPPFILLLLFSRSCSPRSTPYMHSASPLKPRCPAAARRSKVGSALSHAVLRVANIIRSRRSAAPSLPLFLGRDLAFVRRMQLDHIGIVGAISRDPLGPVVAYGVCENGAGPVECARGDRVSDVRERL